MFGIRVMQYELFSDEDFQNESPFVGRTVCLIGVFRWTSKVLQQKLQELGAEIKQGLSRNLHYVVLGKDAPADTEERLWQLALHGFQPRVLGEQDLDNIFNGQYSAYAVPEQIRKNLHLTYRHYLSLQFNYEGGSNPLYTKELYLPSDMQTDLYQRLGNQGIYASPQIDDSTDVIVLSNASLCSLQNGQADETLRYIEEQYNQSRAQSFRFRLTGENELLAWLRLRE